MTKHYVRMSGLGGQGVVTAAAILGNAAIKDGKMALSNPFFGAEKRLAPAESYVRIADEPVYDAGEIIYPSIIMVYHPDVILMGKSYTMPFFSGIQRDGVIIINARKEIELADADKELLRSLTVGVHFFPATEVSREVTGSELSTNVAMLGALLGVTGIVSRGALGDALRERFGGTSRFVASGTTAVLDDAVKEQYAKKDRLLRANAEVLEKSCERALALVGAGANH